VVFNLTDKVTLSLDVPWRTKDANCDTVSAHRYTSQRILPCRICPFQTQKEKRKQKAEMSMKRTEGVNRRLNVQDKTVTPVVRRKPDKWSYYANAKDIALKNRDQNVNEKETHELLSPTCLVKLLTLLTPPYGAVNANSSSSGK
jgi:hypothetical protein